MEGQAAAKVPAEGETITDIQNYLASFNKEIQDGAAQVMSDTVDESGTVTEATTESTETYYVTETGTTQVTGYQAAFEAAVDGGGGGGEVAEQYNGGDGTFYQTTQYYTTVSADQPGTQYTVQEFHTTAGQTNTKCTMSNATLLPAGVAHIAGSGQATTSVTSGMAVRPVTVALSNTRGQEGIQQIVLAATEGREVNDSEATEISVTIPAALAGQAGAEELLQAVEAQADHDGQTYVAMQPNGQRVVVSSSSGSPQVVTVSGSSSGIAALISQADGVVHQTQSNVGRPQTIRMVVQQPDGTEQQQDVEVATTEGEGVEEVGEGSVVTHGTLEMMANLAEQASEAEVVGGSEGDDGQQQVLLNSGNSFQTVTIVPSESNPGEVSYVLIVSQPDEEKGEKDSEVDVDMSIYDFNEGEQQGTQEDGEGDEARGNNTDREPRERPRPTQKSARVTKVAPKKSQSVTQAHMCNYCNYTSPKRYLLSRHMKSHSEERPHKCSVCERGFKTLASLQNHVNTHTGTRPHQCKECESAFTTSGELVRHVRYKHTHEKPHRCTECEYASVELSKLKRHMRCHTGERPYQCPHCTYASPDTYKLKRHLRIHTGEKPYECDICRARFTQSNSLKAHKLIHTGNKPIFQCELCPTTCGRKTDLRIHVQKLHTSEKPLKCRRCGKSFPDRYTYKVHSKTHEGEKCFKCDLCPYASISQRHLESHMLIHTDQKPYQCDLCEQSFRQKQLLKRHRNLYHNPDYVPPTPKEKTHECSECGRAFRHKGNLIRHMAIHDPDATAQEKEAAMMIHRRYKKKRINEHGVEEEYSEEEEEEDYDEDYDDDDYDDDDENEISVGRQITTADGQQVVVLEVIQLQGPEGEQQAVAVLAGDGMEMMDASGVADGTAIMANSEIGTTLNAEIIEHATGEIIDGNTTIMVETPRKLRRTTRARIEAVVDADADGMDVSQEDGFATATIIRSTRGRRRKNDDDEDYVCASPAKRGRGRGAFGSGLRGRRPRAAVGDEASNSSMGAHTAEELEAYLPSEEEIARREAEAAKRRQEQKRKDLEECFGFKDEDEDDSDQVDTSATESAIQMLAAMQNEDQ